MIRAIVEHCFYAYNGICSHRSLLHRLLNTLFYCGEIVLRNSAPDNDLVKYIRRLQIPGRLKCHLDMSVLTMSAGLLFILVLDI